MQRCEDQQLVVELFCTIILDLVNYVGLELSGELKYGRVLFPGLPGGL